LAQLQLVSQSKLHSTA